MEYSAPQKEWYTDIQNYMVGPWKHYSKSQKPITKKKTDILWLYLYEIARTASSLETEYRLVVVHGWGRVKNFGAFANEYISFTVIKMI